MKTGKGETGHAVKFDLFPADNKKVPRLQRQPMTVLAKDAEEPQVPKKDVEELAEIKDKKRRRKRRNALWQGA